MIEFNTTPDAVGMGRIIFCGRHYGLPAALVAHFRRLHEGAISPDAAASQSNVETPVKHEEAPGT